MPRGRRPTSFYIAAGKEAIIDLLGLEHAATWQEIQAKIADRPWGDSFPPVDPHHLTTARRELVLERRITESFDTYAGRQIGVVHLTDLSRRRTAFDKAARRKRRLTARYLRWATSTPRHPSGLIGGAAEDVVHASLLRAAAHGYRVIRPKGGDVRSLFAQPIPGGPLDNAAFLQVLDDDGRPLPALLVPIEVKNGRHWLYPNAEELYQLLYKAARLRELSGETEIVPVLICRRRAFITYQFARALGFVAFETQRQYLLAPEEKDAERKLDEVRLELGYADLLVSNEPDPQIVRLFEETLPNYGPGIGIRWSERGCRFVHHYNRLRRSMGDAEQSAAVDALKEEMAEQGIVVEW